MFRPAPIQAKETIARTLFLTSVGSFVLFLAADLARPGFVSRYVSVHWFLGAAILSGAWWAYEMKEAKSHAVVQAVVAVLFSAAAASAVWSLHEAFGEYVVLGMLLAATVPFAVWGVLRSVD